MAFHSNPTKDSVIFNAVASDNYGCVGNLRGLLTCRDELLYHPSFVTSHNFLFPSFLFININRHLSKSPAAHLTWSYTFSLQ